MKEYIEELFKNYRKNKFKIKLIDIEIKEMENSYEGCTGLDMSKEKSSPTHKFSSDVENEIINKERKIEKLRRNKIKIINEIQKVECLLEYLKDKESIEGYNIDRKLIECRYMNKMSWWKISKSFGMDYRTCKERIDNTLIELEGMSAVNI